MPFLLSLANFANGVVWSTYALLRWDPFVAVIIYLSLVVIIIKFLF